MHYNEQLVANGQAGLEGLGNDVAYGGAKAGPILQGVSSSDGGIMYGNLIGKHDESVQALMDLLDGLERLLGNAATKVGDTVTEYSKGEQANLESIKELWSALEMDEGMEPVGPPPAGSTAQADEQWWTSSLWRQPETQLGHWIFNVLSWPDYLSAGTWIRKLIDVVARPLLGESLWDWLWSWLGGDWTAVDLASDAWDIMGEYFEDMSDELVTRMQLMFAGWYDSDAATTAGGYFAKAADAIAAVSGPMADLTKQYHNVAWSSWMLCQAVYSIIDAIVDTALTALLTGTTFLEALAAPFTGGATAATGIVTLILAAVEAVSAVWGYMMTAVYLIGGAAAALGANLTEIEWVTLPEG